MNKIFNTICKYSLKTLSGNKELYIVELKLDNEPHLLLKKIDGDDLHCLEWNGTRYRREQIVHFNDLATMQIEITHHAGDKKIISKGLKNFAINYIKVMSARIIEKLKSPKAPKISGLKIRSIKRYILKLLHLITNSKLSFRDSRFITLRAIVNNYTKQDSDYIAIDKVIEDIKEHNRELAKDEKRIENIIDSLIKTGEIEGTEDGALMITGKAIDSFEKLSQEKDKNRNIRFIQAMLVVLLVIILFF